MGILVKIKLNIFMNTQRLPSKTEKFLLYSEALLTEKRQQSFSKVVYNENHFKNNFFFESL